MALKLLGGGAAAKASGSKMLGWGLFTKLKAIIITLFFGIILINTVLVSLEAQDPLAGLEYLGQKFFVVTKNLNDASTQVIEQQGVYDGSNGFLKGSWGVATIYWTLLESLIIFYLWLVILAKAIMWIFLYDTSKQPSAYALAFVGFFMTQLLFILIFTEESPSIIYESFLNFFKAFPYLLGEVGNKVGEFADKYVSRV